MEPKKYICNFCGNDYNPKRRHVQRFCCNSCRSKAHIKKHQLKTVTKSESNIQNQNPFKIEKISLAGVGNAAIGTLAVNAVSNLFTSEGNKPATKNDIKNLTSILKNRYLPILNIPNRIDGAKAFYDTQIQQYVFIKTQK
jgi:hypothetical protein